MTDNELKKLNRTELLKLLIEQSEEVERLKNELEQTREALNSREVRLQKAGSIAEASLAISGIFSAAQDAAEIYLANIRNIESDKTKILDDARVEADGIIAEAKVKADAYWDEVSAKLENFYDAHMGLREMLSVGDVSKHYK